MGRLKNKNVYKSGLFLSFSLFFFSPKLIYINVARHETKGRTSARAGQGERAVLMGMRRAAANELASFPAGLPG